MSRWFVVVLWTMMMPECCLSHDTDETIYFYPDKSGVYTMPCNATKYHSVLHQLTILVNGTPKPSHIASTKENLNGSYTPISCNVDSKQCKEYGIGELSSNDQGSYQVRLKFPANECDIGISFQCVVRFPGNVEQNSDRRNWYRVHACPTVPPSMATFSPTPKSSTNEAKYNCSRNTTIRTLPANNEDSDKVDAGWRTAAIVLIVLVIVILVILTFKRIFIYRKHKGTLASSSKYELSGTNGK